MILLLLLLIQIPPSDESNKIYGPMSIHGHSFFQLTTSDFIPNEPIVDFDYFKITGSISSIFNYDKNHRIDTEVNTIEIEYWKHMTDRFVVGTTLSTTYVGGGFVDRFINEFHRIFNIQHDRFDFPDNKSTVDFGDSKDLHAIFLNDPTLMCRYKLINGENYGILVGSRLSLPIGNNVGWIDTDWQGSIECAAHLKISNFYFYGAASLVRVNSTIFGFDLVKWQASLILTVDWQWSETLSFITQIQLCSSAVDIDNNAISTEIAVGFRLEISNGVEFEVGATENLFTYDNSVDFAFGIGIIFKK